MFSTSNAIMLDMLVFRQGASLLTKCYQKPLNAYLYLPYNSEHPRHIWFAVIRGELIRYAKRCSLFADFQTMKSLFALRLRRRGYPSKVIRAAYKTVTYSNRAVFLQIKPPADTTARVTPFVLTYSAVVFNMGLHRLFYQNLKWLLRLPHFQGAKFIVAWRAPPKLAQALVTYQHPRTTPALP